MDAGIELRSSHFGGQHFTSCTISQARLLTDPAGSFLSGSALDSPTQQSPHTCLCVQSGTVCLVEGFFGTNLIGSGRRTVPTGEKQASATPSDISRSSGEKGLKPQLGTGGAGISDCHRNGASRHHSCEPSGASGVAGHPCAIRRAQRAVQGSQQV